MGDLQIYKVVSSPWEPASSREEQRLLREICVFTNFGERVQSLSITRAARSDGSKAMGILIATNFKIIDPSKYNNSPQSGDWLLGVCKVGEGNLCQFSALCTDTSFGSLLAVLEPKDMHALLRGFFSPKDIQIELHGPDGLLDVLFSTHDEHFPTVFGTFWNSPPPANSANPPKESRRRRWLGIF